MFDEYWCFKVPSVMLGNVADNRKQYKFQGGYAKDLSKFII